MDFAYRVHTEIGHKCRGAKVNGRIVPLNYNIKTGDQIEILTGANAKPRRDWLYSENGYVNTSRARAKVATWFKNQNRDQNIIDGKALLTAQLKRVGLLKPDAKKIAKELAYDSVDDFYAALGACALPITQVIKHQQQKLEPKENVDEQLSLLPLAPFKKVDGSDVYINGVGKLLSSMASCCQPLPGDAIMGYVTQGRGVSIHKADCTNLLNLKLNQANRITEVSWGDSPEKRYPLELFIKSYDRRGLLKDITITLANDNVNVLAMNSVSNDDGTADLIVGVEIESLQHLGKVLNKIQQLPNIMDVHRHQH